MWNVTINELQQEHPILKALSLLAVIEFRAIGFLVIVFYLRFGIGGE